MTKEKEGNKMILKREEYKHFQIIYIYGEKLRGHGLMGMLCTQPIYGHAHLWEKESGE